MKLITKVAVKRTRRAHPEWTPERILEHVKVLTDAAGSYKDTVTLQDVRDVLYSMDPPRRLL